MKLFKSRLALGPFKKVGLTLLLAATCLTGPMVLYAQGRGALPTLGDGSDMSSSSERRLGDRIAREIYRDPDFIDDPVLGEYVQGIWQPLLAAARSRGEMSQELDERFAWEIMLGRDRTVNAFALPGGYFGVHLGLIAIVSSRDELASVLGHELSHVTQRHISRLISRQSQQAPWMMGAMILGALAASKSPDAGNALIVGGQALSAQSQLNFSRDMEREADRVGFGLMTQAGFEAQGFVSMFGKLQQASRLNDNGAYPYLRSHPLTTERIADMQSRLALEPAAKPGAGVLSTEHALIATRAGVLSNLGVDALQAMMTEADGRQFVTLSAPQQAAVLYGAALASSRLRDFASSQGYLSRLQAAVALQTDPAAARLGRLLAAELALTAGDLARATQLLKASPGTGRPELIMAAQVATQQAGAELEGVAQRLQSWVLTRPRDAQAWQLLAAAYTAQGRRLAAIRAEAEAQVALLNYSAAVDRFSAAQALLRQGPVGTAAADHIEGSIIDTRKRQVALWLKEQTLER